MIFTLFDAIARGAGWTLLLGMAFWAICIGLSYARIGITKLVARRHREDELGQSIHERLAEARTALDAMRDKTNIN